MPQCGEMYTVTYDQADPQQMPLRPSYPEHFLTLSIRKAVWPRYLLLNKQQTTSMKTLLQGERETRPLASYAKSVSMGASHCLKRRAAFMHCLDSALRQTASNSARFGSLKLRKLPPPCACH